jgi:SnoaL-like domain
MAIAWAGPRVWSMDTTSAPQDFLEQLAARDYDALAATLAPDATARMLLPRRVDEASGADAIARRFEGWFGGAETFAVLSTGSQPVGGRWLLRWRFQLCRDGQTNEVIEQVAFADVGPAGISRLDLVCSGFLPEIEAAAACAVA